MYRKIRKGKQATKNCILICMLMWGILQRCPTCFVYAVGVSPVAVAVYGQGGSFTASTANNGGTSANSLSSPYDTKLDSSGDLYVSDGANNRVLYYPVGSTVATRVYGQGGSFITGTVNKGGISADSLDGPQGLVLDSGNNLYIADTYNSRVLYYPAGSTTATLVYGQGGSFTTGTVNKGGISANSIDNPNGLWLDSSNGLYVTDYYNNRVLYYPAGSTTSTRVYGQGGSFTTGTTNKGGISADSFNAPISVFGDSSNNIYISDNKNHRILYYPAGSTTATRVYGQGGSFTTGGSNNGGLSATSLSYPAGLAIDATGSLYAIDNFNARILYYPAGSTTPTRVYGQGGNFAGNSVGTTATELHGPVGIAIDNHGDLYATDDTNNRVVEYQTALSVTTQPAASIIPGYAFTVVVQLIDVGSGATFTDFTGTVSVAIKAGSGTGGATLSGTTSVAAVSGVATFSNLSINTLGTGYILTMSTPGVNSLDTTAFTIVGKLLFTPLTSPSFSYTLTGATGTIPSQHTFKVNDTTQSGVGWHVTITSAQLAATGGYTLPVASTTITAVSSACTSGQTCVVPTNGISGYPITVPAATTAPAAVSFFSATGGTGTGDVTVTVTFSLNIPPGTASGTYAGIFTVMLVKGQ